MAPLSNHVFLNQNFDFTVLKGVDGDADAQQTKGRWSFPFCVGKASCEVLIGFSNVVFFLALYGVDHMAESFVFKMN